VIERGDDDDLHMRDVFTALRRHVVKVSAGFGARLAIRLSALAAARDKGDPSLLDIFASVMSEATAIVTSALSEPSIVPPPPASPNDAAPPSPTAAAPKDEPDA
jgi:hypothetical protein